MDCNNQFLKSPITQGQAIQIAEKYGVKNNLTATTAPTVNSDASEGYSNSSLWYNTSSSRVYLCVDNTDGAAVWADLTSTATTGSFQGFWNASSNTPTLADGTGSNGDYYFTSTGGTQNLGSGAITFGAGDMVIYDSAIWAKIPAQNLVSSVFGRLGAIVATNGDYTASQVTNAPAGNIVAITVQAAINELDGQDTTITASLSSHTSNTSNPHSVTKTQVGLGNADNTSDANKPVSTAQQTALDLKEALANKATSFSTLNDILYPSVQAVETRVRDLYKGAWSASSNIPSIANGTGTNGDYYRVSVSGSQNLGAGAVSYYAGNTITYNGSTWEQSGSSTANSTAARQAPSGLINGANTIFTLSNAPLPNTLAVYLNGMLQDLTSDYTFSGVTITFVAPPTSGETILTTYYYN